ncbi:hypothetical protein [Thiohalobacter thiocyanaticus]|uniref:Uncharacterized protein n=1 Tax=Thiohalobacter thiocyanaticus TaxID=585455 RepID=A0A426QHW2_9GAMM|nr:hypothetical protein [Thiohalobacter thiocyanaticus]RRQ21355.1 hypothetical protein D6C00_04980 [Thiohalobacter thiocyanaticus]
MSNLRRHLATSRGRRVLAALLLLFAGMQFASLAHAAEHAFTAHEHFGQACDVLHFAKHGGDGVAAALPAGACDLMLQVAPAHVPADVHSASPFSPAQPRAPPRLPFV